MGFIDGKKYTDRPVHLFAGYVIPSISVPAMENGYKCCGMNAYGLPRDAGKLGLPSLFGFASVCWYPG
jgi:hypothetical protein